jgi:hypothetical protein
MTQDLEESFQYFLGEAQELGRLYRTVRELFLDDPAMVSAMNATAPGFFIEVLGVYSDAISLSMARLCDHAKDGNSGRNNLSVKRYLEAIKDRNHATDVLLDAAHELLAISGRTDLTEFRNRFLAHNDEPTALKGYEFRVPQWEEIGEFLKHLELFTFEAARILNIKYSRQLMTRAPGRHVPVLKKYLQAAETIKVEWSFAENWNSRFYRNEAKVD